MVVSPRDAIWLRTLAFHASYGGRTHCGVVPVTFRISAWVMSIWESTADGGSVVRSGWLQVWSSTGNPAAATILEYWG